jgi:putative transposase
LKNNFKKTRGSLNLKFENVVKLNKGTPMKNFGTKISIENEKSKHIREVLEQGDIAMKLSLIRNVRGIVELLIKSVFEDEIREKAGDRYKRYGKHRPLYRWGTNPGSIRVGEEKIGIRVPRLRNEESGQEVTLESYHKLKESRPDEERLVKGVIHGLSMNDYHEVVREFEDSYGLSRSQVSQKFKEQSARRVKEFYQRDLGAYNFVALFMDGKYLAKEQMVIVLGITEEGEKLPLGFIQTHTENSLSIKELLTSLVERGLKYEEGLLCIIDGSKGLKKALEETFGKYCLIKRCAWHKRENMLSYLPETRKEEFKKQYDKAYAMSDYQEAQNAFIDLSNDLHKVNTSASRSILDGLDELLTLHRLNLIEDFGKSFSTTNIIENINSQLTKYIGKVKYWQNSDQRERWVASALVEIEPRLKKVNNYRNLSILKERIKTEITKKIFENNLLTS